MDEIRERLEKIEVKIDKIDQKMDHLTVAQTEIRWLKRLVFSAWAAIIAMFGFKG